MAWATPRPRICPPRASPATPTQYFQYNEREARVRELTRIAWKPPWDIMVATTYRYDSPGIYGNSKLSTDANNHVLHGTNPGSLAVLGLGLVYDTRDNEFFPHRGSYHQIGNARGAGLPHQRERREYGRLRGDDRALRPADAGRPCSPSAAWSTPSSVTCRLLDLYTGGPFQTYEMIGGSAAVRGVPDGRYSGPLKVLGNAELRSLFIRFTLLKQKLPHGRQPALRRRPPVVGLHLQATRRTGPASASSGVRAAAVYLVWGAGRGLPRRGGLFSPDAKSENPGSTARDLRRRRRDVLTLAIPLKRRSVVAERQLHVELSAALSRRAITLVTQVVGVVRVERDHADVHASGHVLAPRPCFWCSSGSRTLPRQPEGTCRESEEPSIA